MCATRTTTQTSEITACAIVRTFAQRESTGVSVGEKGVLRVKGFGKHTHEPRAYREGVTSDTVVV